MSRAVPPWHGAQLKHRDKFTFTLFYMFLTYIIIRGPRNNI